jgi:capsular polysaccharide biosynthesis protein
LSKFFKTSMFMKIIALIILCYTIYLNNKQINLLSEASNVSQSEQVKSQLYINIVCSYVFTVFIGLLILFLLKSFFI